MKFDFQTIMLGVFGVAVIAAIAIFATSSGSSSSNSDAVVKVTAWGDIDPNTGLADAITAFNDAHRKTTMLTYVYHTPDNFDEDLIEAIANGKSPDFIFLPNSRVLRLEDKLIPIPYTSIPTSVFAQQYVDSAKAFLAPEGVLGVPLAVDPMVLYWNKDLFTNAGIVEPPKYWDDVITLQPKLTKQSAGDINSFDYTEIALGGYDNVNHAKDIIATLFLQAGIPIVARDTQTGRPKASLDSGVSTTGEPPVDSAIRFYTDFANPDKTLYTWNRTLPNSLDMFLSGKLAMYIGRASDYRVITMKNPHLNFSIAQVPQMRTATVQATGGEVYALAIMKAGHQTANAFKAFSEITGDASLVQKWAQLALIPPARRDLLALQQTDAILPYFYTAALQSRAWLDPKRSESDKAFHDMADGISTGKFQVPDQAASFLRSELDAILNRVLPQI